MNSSAPYKVIYDTDPGVDDTMALYFALAHPRIDVLGITTTFGNVRVEQAALNALYLSAIAGANIPVTQGAATPLCKPAEAPPAHIHGADGLGNLPARVATSNRLDPRSSAQFIVDMARALPGEITLVAVGPLGNLSRALEIEPRLGQLLRQVIIMGGTLFEPGNVSEFAEANIWSDPHAAQQVFNASWALTMVGLDVTHRVILPVSLFDTIARTHRHLATDTLRHAVGFYADYYSRRHPHVGDIYGCFAHDVLAFVYLVNPELFSVQTACIRVVTEGPHQGQTVLMEKDPAADPESAGDAHRPRAQVCLQVQAEDCKRVIADTLMRPWLG